MDEAEFQRRAERASVVEDWFLWPTSIAAVLCLPIYLIPAITKAYYIGPVSTVLDWVIWGVFAVELAVLLVLVPDRVPWLRHHRLTLFIVVAAFPGFAILTYGTALDGFAPALLLAQKLLKLSKVDRLIRKRRLHVPLGPWLLVAPVLVAEVVVWDKTGWIGVAVFSVALGLLLLGSGRRPDAEAVARMRRRARDRARDLSPI